MGIKKVEEKKTVVKIKIQFYDDGTATIFRPDMPFITDKAEKSVTWLKEKGYKEDDIEVVGKKSYNWDTEFPKDKEPSLVEKISESLN